ncbi:NAD(P)H-binding protein [Acetilactobacillus jinshanensis]|uniref:NAD(P)-binding domain-containing protein n=1 Tax=Acetilactobacillus jinshanensis TaxID=1720083 RepID=A0A4P6ZJM5_9LACO|nr:NAD(P)H-binding protein [Acetilactobacillus jinshanensis]QBP17733.1 hypothetical protein ELX58_00765 [Acetilactobacillus jinshanensis]URL60595.1 NAD(P)H-binding protein [uncultured bacterium]
MSKNRQVKPNQDKDVIHTVLMIVNPSPATIQLRNRIINQRNSKDRVGIVTEKPGTLNASSTTREIIFNVNLKNEPALSKLIQSQGFDTVYIDLKQANPDLMHNIMEAASGTQVNRVILALNDNDKPSDAQVNKATEIVKRSGIHYTIIRRAKLNRYDLISYQVVNNAQPVSDSSVSPSSVADLAYQIIEHPNLHSNVDLGIAQLPYK